MQFLRTILLILAVLASSWYNSLVLALFETQQSYFASELCEQKEVEGNTCQGSCQLRALLQTKEEPEAPFAPNFTEEISFLLFDEGNLKQPFPFTSQPLLKFPAPEVFLAEGMKRLVWRPPC